MPAYKNNSHSGAFYDGTPVMNRESQQAQGLVGWYPTPADTVWTNASAGRALTDYAGAYMGDANNETLNPTSREVRADDIVGGYVRFPYATFNAIKIPANTILNGGNDEISWSCWARLIGSAQPRYSLIFRDNTFSASRGLYFEAGATMAFRNYCGDWDGPGGVNGTGMAQSTGGKVTDQWYFVVGTCAGQNVTNGLKIYVDGLLENTANSSTDSIPTSNWSIATGGTYRDLDGDMADIRIYDRVLSDAEVWAMYDPQTRWDLYYRPSARIYTFPAAGGGSYQSAWVNGTVTIQ